MRINKRHGDLLASTVSVLFLSGRSTVTNLCRFTQFVSNSFGNKHQVDVIYTDFSKGFDKLSHEILLVKLLNIINLSGHLVQLIYSHLSSRFQYVKHYAYESDWISVTSGVPQRLILGPVLFNVFINDILKGIKSEVLMYADDFKIFRCISSVNDCPGRY